ncbi:hypothetical protein MPDQ_002449 [Monascus purpureus]|uniref:FHA domain-containing protein n=1 Tax=Monascus purpureus TaxID=5098 RepID=A0A507QKE8_MONPU|nr:hypothetical protein MPDQ_002449 [Monascus purpureus]
MVGPFGHRLPWFSPTSQAHSPTSSDYPSQTSPLGTSAPSPDADQPALARYISAPSGSSGNYQALETVDLRPQPPPSESSRSSDSERRSSGLMARLRGGSTHQNRLSRPPESRNPEATSTADMRPTESPVGSQDRSSETLTRRATTESRSTPVKPNRKATIRFYPYHDPSANSKPSLPFVPITRVLPADSCLIRVGRYSERDGIPNPNPSEPSDAPVGFKSKVVSRKHCEFLYLNGQWHIKDVGSSSGTFLNHMRLSQPNMVSRLYAIKDGDIVQLGIDFRGGEEMIFRCVRIRIECNRSWQQQPNEFNKNTESLIRNLGKGGAADYAGCRECSICLGSVLRPYQCLFMAACAHVWHYKCISRLIHTPEYPMFQCPNCRAYTDLSAEVDDSNDYEEEVRKEPTSEPEPEPERGPSEEAQSTPMNTIDNRDGHSTNGARVSEEAELAFTVGNLNLHDGNMSTAESEDSSNSQSPAIPSSNIAHSPNIDIPRSRTVSSPHSQRLQSGRESSEDNFLTPRNDSGPLAFDGRAGVGQSPSRT